MIVNVIMGGRHMPCAHVHDIIYLTSLKSKTKNHM